jgi:hypothetical protein
MSAPARSDATVTEEGSVAFYRRVMTTLREGGVPFMVGGAYALARYTGIGRATKDFDVFLRRQDMDRALAVLGTIAGCRTEITYGHWLGKAICGPDLVDLIFSSGNGIAQVDDEWFEHAERADVLGEQVLLTPPEEMLWSKAFVMERERYDGADVAHLIRARYATLDWPRLLRRFGSRWRVLLGHLVLFGFIYPGERTHVPRPVMDDLLGRLRRELKGDEPGTDVCQGTIISREQFLADLSAWGYTDGRLAPPGPMTADEVQRWTAAIPEDR